MRSFNYEKFICWHNGRLLTTAKRTLSTIFKIGPKRLFARAFRQSNDLHIVRQTSHYNINHNVNGDDVDDELALTVDASGFNMDQWTSPTHEWIMYRACAQNNRYSQRTMILFIDVTRVKYIRLISILVWPLCQQHKSKSANEWNDMKKYWLLLLINFWYLKIE